MREAGRKGKRGGLMYLAPVLFLPELLFNGLELLPEIVLSLTAREAEGGGREEGREGGRED